MPETSASWRDAVEHLRQQMNAPGSAVSLTRLYQEYGYIHGLRTQIEDAITRGQAKVLGKGAFLQTI